jgi:1,2-diacylglycerol 3-alpha-glucosyltransferase
MCHSRGIPAIVMSDSTRRDEPRWWVKEVLKGLLVRSFSAAIAAGSRSRAYLGQLGVPAESIFEPWDVVDNSHFGIARVGGADPPNPYFICVSRYLPKKNLFRLIEAYAGYLRAHGPGAWDLVILGSGELREKLEAAVAACGVSGNVRMPGFVQYADLPSYYSAAGALVLPSLSDQWGLAVNEAMACGIPVIVSDACGCAPDLVAKGDCGFTFDPTDTGALRLLLAKTAALSGDERARMGAIGRDRIGRYTPRLFAEALVAAAGHAAGNRRKAGVGTRIVLAASTYRN